MTDGSLPEPPSNWRSRSTLTINETAAVLGIGRSSAYVAVRAGEIPSVRVGKRILVLVAPLRGMLGEIDGHAQSSGQSDAQREFLKASKGVSRKVFSPRPANDLFEK